MSKKYPSSASSAVSATAAASANPLSNPATPETDSRKRQVRRDEAIRRKMESELAKRRNVPTATTQAATSNTPKSNRKSKPPPGTVLSLKPSPPLTMKYSASIHQAAQLMSAKRENCVLVLDDDDSVCGIFTAKDLAFKVVGAGLNPLGMRVEQVMTPDPICVRTDSSATDALNLMVTKGFRHVPVMDGDGNVAGVLDITRCFYEAMQKLERAYESSRRLHDALEGVQSELGGAQPTQIISYVEALKRQTEGPDLASVLADGSVAAPCYVDARMPVAEAAAIMRQNRTTAVLVTDHDQITGIFTSKDVVLRVLAPTLDPKTCSVVRVMTPQPDFAPVDMSVQSALRKMHDGHYLNLPVMGPDNEIVGLVDVLKLTYATLAQIGSMSLDGVVSEDLDSSAGAGGSGGPLAPAHGSSNPAWSKFWHSLEDTTESEVSGSARRQSGFSDHLSNADSASAVDQALAAGATGAGASAIDVSAAELAQFDIGPNDSVSRQGRHIQSPLGSIAFPFKFKTPGGRVHRITVSPEHGLSGFRQAILEKLSAADIELLGGPGLVDGGRLMEPGFMVSYVDDDNDTVAITSGQDLADAVAISRSLRRDRAELFLHHPDSPVDDRPKSEPVVAKDELIPGVANELLLPGAVAALAAVIVVVFMFRRR